MEPNIVSRVGPKNRLRDRLNAASRRLDDQGTGSDDRQPAKPEQAAKLKRLAEAAYELEAFQPNLTRAEADLRIAMLTAKLRLLDEPPHTL